MTSVSDNKSLYSNTSQTDMAIHHFVLTCRERAWWYATSFQHITNKEHQRDKRRKKCNLYL